MRASARFSLSGKSPIICTAIHAGSYLSPECGSNLVLSEADKLREEDPYTDELAELSTENIIANYSRFEFDLNRKRESSVYIEPEDSWGLEVRENSPDRFFLQAAYAKYDLFYEEIYNRFLQLRDGFPKIFVYDIHSYNHRRNGPEAEPGELENNPDIVLATGNMPAQWEKLIGQLQEHFSEVKIAGRKLNVRKNVKFEGGWFSRWLHYTFPDSVCCLSIEFKKIFMDEWTGELDKARFEILQQSLAESFHLIKKFLKKFD